MSKPLFNIPYNTFERLSDTERYLLTYIHDHLDEIATMSIVTLSERAAVSTATVVRLMKKLVLKAIRRLNTSLNRISK